MLLTAWSEGLRLHPRKPAADQSPSQPREKLGTKTTPSLYYWAHCLQCRYHTFVTAMSTDSIPQRLLCSKNFHGISRLYDTENKFLGQGDSPYQPSSFSAVLDNELFRKTSHLNVCLVNWRPPPQLEHQLTPRWWATMCSKHLWPSSAVIQSMNWWEKRDEAYWCMTLYNKNME